MPPRDQNLPEGTDQIIGGAARMDDAPGYGSSGAANAGTSLVATGTGDDTGGTARNTGGSTGTTSGTGSKVTDKLVSQVKDQVSTLRGQAGTKLRAFADDGKGKTENLLDEFAGLIEDAAQAVEQRFGGEYAQYARSAATQVQGLKGKLNGKSVDDLMDDTRDLVRQSPGMAIGVAAVAGFALMRVLKTGLEEIGAHRSNTAGQTGATGTSATTGTTGFAGTEGSTGTTASGGV